MSIKRFFILLFFVCCKWVSISAQFQFNYEDSIGLFDADKKNVFQKTELENYFTENPSVQKNIESLFVKLPTNKNRINLRTEYDSYEYLIWVYSKKYFNNNFYIGTSEHVGYKSYSKNLKDSNFYFIQISDKNKVIIIRYSNLFYNLNMHISYDMFSMLYKILLLF